MTPKAFRRPLMEINGIWRGLIDNLPPRHQISLGKDLNQADKAKQPFIPLKKVV